MDIVIWPKCFDEGHSITRIAQVYLVFRAHMTSGSFSPGPESDDARLMAWQDIPWDDLAFPSVRWALSHFDKARDWQDIVPERKPPAVHWER